MRARRSTARARRFTSAHGVALLALFIALGGTVYAAARINGKVIKPRSIPANRVKKNSLGGAQIKEESLGTVPSAVKAETATSAASADSAATATSAASAANAEKLGSLPPASYQQACKQGVIKASLVIDTTGLGASETSVPGFNCSGGEIKIRRTGPGSYSVRFVGTTASSAIGGSAAPGLGVSVRVAPDPMRAGEVLITAEVFRGATQTFEDGATISIVGF